MDRIITPDLEPFVFTYLDDIIIVTETMEDHERILKIVLTKIKEAGLTINPDKCVFCQQEVRYLGVLVNRDRFCPDPAKIEPILKISIAQKPETVAEILGNGFLVS